MDLADLVVSHGDEEPSGENLEYDPAFISLELAAQPGEERQIGDSIIAAEEPDYPEVITQAMDVLGRAHDLRAAVFLAQAMLRTKGFPGFAEVTSYMRGVLEQFWDTCHPQLDADDDNDPTMRVNAVTSLSGPDTIIRAMRITPLTDSRAMGRFSYRDILIAEGEMSPPEGMDNPPSLAQIAGAFQDTNPDKLNTTRNAVAQALEDVTAINAIFQERTPTQCPDLDVLERMLRQILNRFQAAGVTGGSAAKEVPKADEEDDAEAGAQGGGGVWAGGGWTGGPAMGGGVPGGINNQQDVKNTIDRLIAYYTRAEPSSPVPILLERAKRLVGADFVSIIKDMAPDGKDNVYLIGGIPPDEED